MQIVIDIHEARYRDIKRIARVQLDSNYFKTLEKIIAEGKPLPKGHGDLVDFDRLCEEYWDGNYMEIHKDDLSNIKPIIEADKEDKNE